MMSQGWGELRCMLALLLALAGCAPDAPDSPTAKENQELADEVCPAVDKAFFFTIEKDGATSYLLGTRHAGVPLAKFPVHVRDAFGRAQTLVTESEIDMDRAVPPPARSVEDELGDDWQHYRKLVGKQTADRINHRSVQAASASIFLLYEDTEHSLDLELQRSAKAAGHMHVALEDHATGDAIGEELLGIAQLRSLLKMARNRAAIRTSTTSDLRAYCTGAPPAQSAPEAHASLEKRNQAWLTKLEPLLARGDVFIAVGRAHVTEVGGLVDMLRERGFKLTHAP